MSKVKIVKVGATWCRPCIAMDVYMGDVINVFGDEVELQKLDAEEDAEKVAALNVTAIPTLVIFKEDKEVKRLVGLIDRVRLQSTIQEIVDEKASGSGG